MKIIFVIIFAIASFTANLGIGSGYDSFAKKSCDRATQITVNRGFRYNDFKPYGLQNPKNWAIDWSKTVTICSNGRECGLLRRLLINMLEEQIS